ncbi:ECF transporter S component [Clostridium akagii]|uniref:ECF transporter S component n=1 Tax=Clostridium akagii TaxID=91623 RepID=UPI00047DD2CD|nr:ECF transporter S component [Clostridium akagii]
MKNSKLNFMTKVAMLSVIGFLLMFIEIPIPIFPTFLKLDISDLPALIGAFIFGPVAGIVIELIKNILHGLFVGGSAFIGEFANFVAGALLASTAALIYRRKKTKANAVFGLITGVIVMSIGTCIIDYFIVFPLYETLLHFPEVAVVAMGSKINSHITSFNSFLVLSILPFNILKGIVVSVITMAVYKKVSPFIHKEAAEDQLQKAESKIS